MLNGAKALAITQYGFPCSRNETDGSSGSPHRSPCIYLLDLAHLRELHPQTVSPQPKNPLARKLTGRLDNVNINDGTFLRC